MLLNHFICPQGLVQPYQHFPCHASCHLGRLMYNIKCSAMLCYAVKSYGIQCNAMLFRKYEKGLFRFGNPRFFHFFFDFGLEKSHHQIHLQRILYDFIKLLSIAKNFIAIEKHCTALHSTAQCCTNVQHCSMFYSIAKHF